MSKVIMRLIKDFDLEQGKSFTILKSMASEFLKR